MKWKLSSDYLLDLLVRMAHHSTAIEGNSLTLGETRTILLDGKIPKPMDAREFYEVRNYLDLITLLKTKADNPIEIRDIQNINKILLRDIDTRGGEFKKIPNIIIGADFIPVPPYMVPEKLKEWSDNLQWRLENAKDNHEKVTAIMEQHLWFEQIHPFPDGNGRTGRALMIWSCLGNQITPIVIEKEQREEYIRALNDRNVKDLVKLAEQIQVKEEERMLIFEESEKLTEKEISDLEKLRENIVNIHKNFPQTRQLEKEYNEIIKITKDCYDKKTFKVLNERYLEYYKQCELHRKHIRNKGQERTR